MKHLLIVLLFPVLCAAQQNAGMPLIKDVATHLFYQYTTSDTSSFYEFQKRSEGWFIRLYKSDGTYSTPELFWDKTTHRYLPLDLQLQNHPDSATVAETFAIYVRHYRLVPLDITFYNRNLFYGYTGWEWDVITTLEKNPPTSDSLRESLAAAYDMYSGGFIVAIPGMFFQNDDPDRTPMSENRPFPPSRLHKFLAYQEKAWALFREIAASDPNYQSPWYDIRWRINSELMFARATLTALECDSLAAAVLQQVSFPDPVLQKARKTTRLIKPNSIVFADGDTAAFPIQYLQTKGERQDLVVIESSSFMLQRAAAYLDRKYHGTLFTAKPAAYLDSSFSVAFWQTDEHHPEEHRLDSFVLSVYASPDAQGLPQIDPSFGRAYRYFSQHPYITIDPRKAKSFYPTATIPARISFTLPGYMLYSDVIKLDIVQKNLFTRHIYFTHPSENPIFEPWCVKVAEGLWEFIP